MIYNKDSERLLWNHLHWWSKLFIILGVILFAAAPMAIFGVLWLEGIFIHIEEIKPYLFMTMFLTSPGGLIILYIVRNDWEIED